MPEKTPQIKQENILNVVEAAIGYLKLVVAMLEELREGKDVEIL